MYIPNCGHRVTKTQVRNAMRKLGLTRAAYEAAIEADSAIQCDDGTWVPVDWWLKNEAPANNGYPLFNPMFRSLSCSDSAASHQIVGDFQSECGIIGYYTAEDAPLALAEMLVADDGADLRIELRLR